MKWPDHLRSRSIEQVVLRSFPALLAGGCALALWQSCREFEGTELGSGSYHLDVGGDLKVITDTTVPTRWTGQAKLLRSGRLSPNGVHIYVWMPYPGRQAELILRTLSEPQPGVYAIVPSRPEADSVPVTNFSGGIVISGNLSDLFMSDSGTVTLRRDGEQLRGHFKMYASNMTKGQPGRRGSLVVTGEFAL